MKCRLALALGLAATIAALTVTARAGAQAPVPAAAAAPVDYNWDVRPILSEYCFRCHGPDEGGRRAALRLDQAESAYAQRPGGQPRFAIVPGKPDESEMIKRVMHANAALRMPPQSVNKTMPPEQVEILRRWIAQGAQYKPHWAYITPQKPAPPQLDVNGRRLNEIDRFVVARLRGEGLALSPEADKETLINRATLALTGLPPTLADVDAFVKDSTPAAYEKLIDRLLASPAYGERMAAYWMDVARYSESDGFLDDLHDRLFWPYRDWVISAFNRNMPFDQFGTWQLAGDLMPSHSKEQRLATAFLRVGKRTTENGAIDEEYRVEYVVDRTNTIGTAFLGLTVGCARCHDHKYDPISNKDFYSLSGFFNSTDEPGYYAPGASGITAGPTLNWTDADTEGKLDAAAKAIRDQEAVYEAARAAAARTVAAKADALASAPDDLLATVKASVQAGLTAHYSFETTSPIPDDQLPKSRPRRRPAPPRLAPETVGRNPVGAAPVPGVADTPAPGENGQTPAPPLTGDEQLARARANIFGRLPSDLVREALVFTPSSVAGIDPAILESPIFRDGVAGKAFYFDDTNRGVLGTDVGYFERTQPFSLDFWILAAQVYEDSAVLNNREEDNSGNAGYQLNLEQNRLRFDVMHSRGGNMIRVLTKSAVPVKQWTHVTVTYDGSSQARGVALYINGVRSDVEVLSDNLTRTIIPNGGGTLGSEYLGLQFGKRFRMTTMKDGAIDEIRVFKKALTPLEIEYLQSATGASSAVNRSTKEAIVELLVAADPAVAAAAARLEELRQAQNLLISVVPVVPVMGDTPTPRKTYVLVRGQYTDHGDEVQPRGLSQIFAYPDSLPKNRLGLAAWLFDPEHPLTSRVFVNRMWQLHFGRGLVETSEDFGSQGSIPTHPELLDWLAVTFRESGWDIKRLHKLILMSATYRQSSNVSDQLLKKDPRNLLVARFPRLRLPAEMVRDNALAASGLLVRTVGGKSAYPYQPPTIWDGLAGYTYPDAERIPADDHHRRSLYTFIKRNAPHPAMATFDVPDRGTSVVRRQTSNTPLQALVLLDDPQYLEAYRTLATQVLKTTRDADAQITTVFRLATRRRPHAAELAPMRAYYDAQLQQYAQDPAAASELIAVGVTPVDPHVDKARLAALMNLTAAVMNTPDAYSLR
jgi:hypothetical protein